MKNLKNVSAVYLHHGNAFLLCCVKISTAFSPWCWYNLQGSLEIPPKDINIELTIVFFFKIRLSLTKHMKQVMQHAVDKLALFQS